MNKAIMIAGWVVGAALVAYVRGLWVAHSGAEEFCVHHALPGYEAEGYKYTGSMVDVWTLRAYCTFEGTAGLAPAMRTPMADLMHR
jgi:hypothetical protein